MTTSPPSCRLASRCGALAGGVALVATLIAPLAAAPALASGSTAETPVPASSALQLTGHGFGHGRGLSQYGARGAATDGLGAQQILDFYYPGTTATTLPSGTTVRVRLDDRLDGGGLQASGTVAGAVQMTDTGDGTTWTLTQPAVRVVPVAGAAQMQVGSGTTWTTVRTLVGHLQLTATSGNVALTAADGSVRTYAGTITSALSGSGTGAVVYPVDTLPVDDYLRGVVPSEMPTSWPAAAVQAQAVAARSYAVAEAHAASSSSQWDLCSTAACQVYAGLGAATSGGDAAVKATAGSVRTDGGAVALTEFSSSNGGYSTAGSSSQPYLAAAPDPYEADAKDPNQTWTASVSPTALAAAWPQVGTPQSVTVLARDGNGDGGGRITKIEVAGSIEAIDLTGDAFRSALGLKSTWFTIASPPVGPSDAAREHLAHWRRSHHRSAP